jgi:hypothetical protein
VLGVAINVCYGGVKFAIEGKMKREETDGCVREFQLNTDIRHCIVYLYGRYWRCRMV